jgi:hypothetical protein
VANGAALPVNPLQAILVESPSSGEVAEQELFTASMNAIAVDGAQQWQASEIDGARLVAAESGATRLSDATFDLTFGQLIWTVDSPADRSPLLSPTPSTPLNATGRPSEQDRMDLVSEVMYEMRPDLKPGHGHPNAMRLNRAARTRTSLDPVAEVDRLLAIESVLSELVNKLSASGRR